MTTTQARSLSSTKSPEPDRLWAAVTILIVVIVSAGFSVGIRSNGREKNANENSDSISTHTTPIRLLNASYDPTREFYQEFNPAFASHWKDSHGATVIIDQSHGGSGKQARAVIDGLKADVVTLALSLDIDAIAQSRHLIETEWQSRLPANSAPYYSTIIFVVRKGNPKNILDWNDLVKNNVEIIAANPKTSGGARWNYLAAWGYALKQELGDFKLLNEPKESQTVEAAKNKAKAFVREIYRRVPVLDTAARGSTNTFVQRGLGDVLIAWENEARLAVSELGKDSFEIVYPSLSIRAEPSVAVVTRNAEEHGTTEVAKAYLEYLYSPVGQNLAAKHFYRPTQDSLVDTSVLSSFPQIELFRIEEVFGSWQAAQRDHFVDGGIFDEIYQFAK